MSDSNNLKLIIDIINDFKSENRENLRDLKEEQTRQSEILKDHKNILVNVEIDLAEHKEGVIQNRTELKEHRKRLNDIEKPKRVFMYLKSILIGIGAMSASIYGIIKLIDNFKH